MRDKRRQVLAELRQQLRQNPRPVVPKRQAEQPPEADDPALLKQALAGVVPLPPANRADLHVPPPAPVPRPQTKGEPKPVRAAAAPTSWVPQAWFNDEQPEAPPKTPEHAALRDALKGVRPIRTDRVSLDLPKPAPIPRQHELDEQAALAESIYAPTSLELRLEGGEELSHLANGVPRSVLRDLRRGRWVIQDEIDLHGATRDEARDLLAAFMGQCRKRGTRCVRVIHGKGRGSPGREPVLKRLVAGWLMNYNDVAAFCQARLPDGGAGALIVLLKAQRPA